MKKFFIAYLILLPFTKSLCAQENPPAVQAGPNNADNLKAYFLVLLKGGPHRSQDSATVAVIQQGHLDNINRLAAMGKLNIAGPFLDEGELKGIYIFDSDDENEVKAMLQSDPAIKAGRLTYEIHPWMTEKGTCLK